MGNPWKEKVLDFNRRRKAEGERASDMDVILDAIMRLPPGQLKKIISDEDVLDVLRKYGWEG